MSSQQQSTDYKRRSSGKRTRRSSRPAVESTASAVADAIDVDAEAPVVKQPAKASATSQKAESTRSTGQAESAAWYERFVNTDRFEGPRRFIRDSWAEIQKVIWPDRETTRNLTLVVIAVSIALGILLGGLDYVLFQLFEALP